MTLESNRTRLLPFTQPLDFSVRDTNACKGVGVLLMIFHHLFYSSAFYPFYDVKHVTDKGIPIISIYSRSAKACVAIFVIMSGYGLYLSWQRSSEGVYSLPAVGRQTIRRIGAYLKVAVIVYLLNLIPLYF